MNKDVKRTQQMFRLLLDAISRPGEIYTYTPDIAYNTNLHDNVMVACETLFDGEVSFHLLEENEETRQEIEIRTLVEQVDCQDADYIVCPKDSSIVNVKSAIYMAKSGTLVNPHENATFLIEVEDLEEGLDYIFRGPGIKGEKKVCIEGINCWLEARNDKNIEFPLGIDIFLFDNKGRIMGFPRTTLVKKVM